MRVAVRVDASSVIGAGHVVRCLTLADALRAQGHACLFVCREHDGHWCDRIARRRFDVARLTAASPDADARETRRAIEAWGGTCDLLVVDHYGLDYRWEAALRSAAGRIAVIDDLADREHECDVLIDQNLVTAGERRYAGRVPERCTTLLGPEYALLQPIYAELHDRVAPRTGIPRRVLVSFGGGTHPRLIRATLQALTDLGRHDLEVDVVDAGDVPPPVAPHITHHRPLPTLAPLIAAADLAVGAAGTTSYERLCLGLPAVVVTVADNQRATAEALGRLGLVRWIGPAETATPAAIRSALEEWFASGIDPGCSARAKALVDGRGTSRVVAVLTVTRSTPLRLRPVALSDEALLLRWANDPVTRRYALSHDLIDAAVHHEWFAARVQDSEGCVLRICETLEGHAVGQVRFDRKDHEWEVSYAVAPELRGRGLGREMLREGLDRLRDRIGSGTVVGRIRRENLASGRICSSLGFKGQSVAGGIVEWRRTV